MSFPITQRDTTELVAWAKSYGQALPSSVLHSPKWLAIAPSALAKGNRIRDYFRTRSAKGQALLRHVDRLFDKHAHALPGILMTCAPQAVRQQLLDMLKQAAKPGARKPGAQKVLLSRSPTDSPAQSGPKTVDATSAGTWKPASTLTPDELLDHVLQSNVASLQVTDEKGKTYGFSRKEGQWILKSRRNGMRTTLDAFLKNMNPVSGLSVAEYVETRGNAKWSHLNFFVDDPCEKAEAGKAHGVSSDAATADGTTREEAATGEHAPPSSLKYAKGQFDVNKPLPALPPEGIRDILASRGMSADVDEKTNRVIPGKQGRPFQVETPESLPRWIESQTERACVLVVPESRSCVWQIARETDGTWTRQELFPGRDGPVERFSDAKRLIEDIGGAPIKT